jgi:hypothetical protein
MAHVFVPAITSQQPGYETGGSISVLRPDGSEASELLLASISDFETMLTQNGTKIPKFFLHINPEEQHDEDAGRTVIAVLANACPAH